MSRFFTIGPLRVLAWRWGVWFHLAGRSLGVVHRSQHTVLFSERYGFTKVLYLGPVVVKWRKQ